MTRSESLQIIRNQFYTQQIDAYIIPSSDPHQSEYLADHWKARAQFSGFTGSAGTLIVTQNHASLWTDSRYFIQAEEELKDEPVQLQRQKVPHAPEHVTWLCEHLPKGSKVGINGWLFSVGQRHFLKNKLAAAGIELLTDVDLVDSAWPDRPTLPQEPIFRLDLSYTGLSSTEKLAQIRAQLKQIGANAYLVSTLDDIAWTLNLRGSDILANPVFISYLFIELDKATLFVDASKLSDTLTADLQKEGISIQAYKDLPSFLKALSATEQTASAKTKVLLPSSATSWNAYKEIHPDQIIGGNNLIEELKAIKNPTEIAQVRKAMLKDGVALTKLFRWLEQSVQQRPVPEAEIATQLATFRAAQGQYFGESFDAIVGYKGNGAIVHYRPEEGKCAAVEAEGVLLLDSGGQYMEGTTDITRTIALSTPTSEQKQAYTAVLKGHIQLDTIQFPEGTCGVQLDTLARMHLWNKGLNYGHGTGHGVGHFLNVHEGPQGFTANPRNSRATTAFQVGMLTSNEPGYYKTNSFGIRIENLILCQAATTPGFLKFETLTLFPIDTQLIELEELSPAEQTWLNEYHAKVLLELSPLLNPEEQAWLAEKCQAIH